MAGGLAGIRGSSTRSRTAETSSTVNVYQSASLTDSLGGYEAAQTVARVFERAVAGHLDVSVTAVPDSLSVDDQHLHSWDIAAVHEDRADTATDANLLLTDQDWGGAAGEVHSYAGGRAIAAFDPEGPLHRPRTEAAHRIQTALHEIGHNLLDLDPAETCDGGPSVATEGCDELDHTVGTVVRRGCFEEHAYASPMAIGSSVYECTAQTQQTGVRYNACCNPVFVDESDLPVRCSLQYSDCFFEHVSLG